MDDGQYADLGAVLLQEDDEKAMIVLRRPGLATISQADGYIFRLVRQALVDRETAPWAFYLVGPDGIREVTEDEANKAWLAPDSPLSNPAQIHRVSRASSSYTTHGYWWR
jgi:hypothetical protein